MTIPTSAFVHGFRFSGLCGEASAFAPDQVLPALKAVEQQVALGFHAVGFLSYEAAGGLNPHLTTHPLHDFPLLWFGLFRERTRAPFAPPPESCHLSRWKSNLSESRYLQAVSRIRELIAAGDCYQVNLTMAEDFLFSGAPAACFGELLRRQPTPYASYLETGRFRILSASPELFFALKGGTITTRPMKGTAPRGRWFQEDEEAKEALRENTKERAENLMIVDLLRNDLGMVSETGSVQVPSLFQVETLPTVHQMTSTVTSRLREGTSLTELFQALFPCGSITGAPKRRSMEIIAELEEQPRGLYTGCIGYVSPGHEAQFSVAIRTLVLDMHQGTGRLGIGSGITHDSRGEAEYAECLAKGRFAREEAREFHLIESLLLDEGYFLLERHLKRLARSAAYFSFPLDLEAARQALKGEAAGRQGKHKVRLLLFPDGRIESEAAPISEAADPLITLARSRTDAANPLLYHKTSLRELYSRELAARPDCTEVIFSNENGEITEGSFSNLVARIGGELLTPPLASGLLPGVFREELLERGEIRERVLTREDLQQAEELYLINSVRKWRRARLVE